jgi:hypothetical protein
VFLPELSNANEVAMRMATSLKVDVGDSRPATLQIAAEIAGGAALLFLFESISE